MESLEALVSMEYPGRFIILGRDKTDKFYFFIYLISKKIQKSPPSLLVVDIYP